MARHRSNGNTVDTDQTATRIAISPSSATAYVNGTGVQLTATVYNKNNQVLNRTVTWQSSAAAIVAVVAGLLTGMAIGSAVITAIVYPEDVSTQITVSVSDEAGFLAGVFGSSSAFAVYSPNAGVTVNGSNQIQTLAPVAGVGPTLTVPNGGTGPVRVVGASPADSYMDTTGGKQLQATGYAGLSQAQATGVAVISTNQSIGGGIITIAAPNSNDAEITIAAGGGGHGDPSVHFQPGDTWIEADPRRYTSARYNLYVASRNATAGRAGAPPWADSTGAISTGANLGNGDRIFLNGGPSGSANEFVKRFLLLFGRDHTAYLTSLRQWALIFAGSPSGSKKIILGAGDSHIDVRNTTARSWIARVGDKAECASIAVESEGVNSSRIVYAIDPTLDLTARYPTTIKPFFQAGYTIVIPLDIGTNTFAIDRPFFPDGVAAANQVYSQILSLARLMVADGAAVGCSVRPVAVECMPRDRGSDQAYYDAARQQLNALIAAQASPPWWDTLLWSANIVQMAGSAPWNLYPSFWDFLHAHMLDIGTILQADYATAVLLRVLNA